MDFVPEQSAIVTDSIEVCAERLRFSPTATASKLCCGSTQGAPLFS